MKIKYTVSVVTYSALDYCKRCLCSVFANSSEGEFELILTANGSNNAALYFNQIDGDHENVTVIHNANNEGFWKPHNEAMKKAKGEFFVCLNDDVTLSSNWLSILSEPLRKDPLGALSCPTGGCSALLPNFHGIHGPHEYCEGACLMARTSLMREHGMFDELPGLAYGDDSNLSLKYRELGYHLYWVDLKMSHARGTTTRHVPEARIWMDLNHAFLADRWKDYLANSARKFPKEITP